jgi:hypothetical protein
VVTVEVRDETTAGDVLAAMELQLTEERTTAREIIRARVHQEVRAHNAAKASRGKFRGLVQPAEEERALNPLRRPRRIDADRQTEVAWDAFERGRILLLVGDRQLTEMDEEVVLAPDSSAVFLKLVPLVGG